MLYSLYELGHAAAWPGRTAVNLWRSFLNPHNPLRYTPFGRGVAAGCEMLERTTRRYVKPEFGLSVYGGNGAAAPVSEEVVWQSPFCRLLHFGEHDGCAPSRSKLLLVAPMSGHHATLLRGTVEALLPHHDVYITDWLDARNVPAAAGRFDLDDYIDTLISIFRYFGGGVHVMAVCQPSVPVLAATALLEAAGSRAVPRSLILAGGPVDTRISETAVNRVAIDRGTEWFRRHAITTVPWPLPGHGRAVYPGFLQLSGFIGMNFGRHATAHRDMFLHLVRGDGDSAARHRAFYDEYLAMMDLTAEFYLQTIDTVFVRHLLPRGLMLSRGRRVDMAAIHRPALMTIEGEHDDITGAGQCHAALDLCAQIPAGRKSRVDCPRVGHYGLFNGSRFRSVIAPRITKFIRSCQPERRAHVLRSMRKGSAASFRRNMAAVADVALGHQT